ncbi:iron-sulfur cluster carrier protein ApbC [Nevskia sp.]|uniref:iron-sulfur cluster carrier protein ApbC n=1 Tax=Nevskia sp. TaxID=1929292 RepID=UPI0025DB8B26|nr:iron-sulfur cluster carrier protein ApbC [Nevskia sp.]
MLRTDLLAALDTVIHPLIGRGLVEAGCIADLSVGATPQVVVELGFPAAGIAPEFVDAVKAAIRRDCETDATVRIGCRILPQAVQKGLNPLPGVANIIAVASGKGGVGKSTVAVNLALALQAEGARVGIVDADVYGPSQPLMLGSKERPTSPDGKRMNPIIAHGLQAMSIGFLLKDDAQPAVWRGPMATQALIQLLTETVWDDLDYLVVDMPPGTGDIQLSLSQRVPVAGSVIVTTPQDIALLDARKGLEMFRKVGIPVLGVVENMATHVCTHCGHEEAIFGAGGGERLAAEAGTELLGRMPLDIRIRQQADSGNPTVAADPRSELSLRYRDIARLAAARLAYGAAGVLAFPNVSISDD